MTVKIASKRIAFEKGKAAIAVSQPSKFGRPIPSRKAVVAGDGQN